MSDQVVDQGTGVAEVDILINQAVDEQQFGLAGRQTGTL